RPPSRYRDRFISCQRPPSGIGDTGDPSTRSLMQSNFLDVSPSSTQPLVANWPLTNKMASLPRVGLPKWFAWATGNRGVRPLERGRHGFPSLRKSKEDASSAFILIKAQFHNLFSYQDLTCPERLTQLRDRRLRRGTLRKDHKRGS